MVDPTERLVNLAFLLGAERGHVTAVRIRDEVAGYGDENQDEAAFKRMLERDKKELRAMGLVIESDAEGNYRLDQGATFASRISLEPGEAAALRAVGMALLDDPSFPFAHELRFALAKIASALREHAPRAVAHTADENPELQGELVALLNDAVQSRKTARFGYTNSY
ncbi:MAG: helix-turn-helix transcriptional regulator, partial [Coriobacteriia bacterium]